MSFANDPMLHKTKGDDLQLSVNKYLEGGMHGLFKITFRALFIKDSNGLF